tara:strand:+ start:128 stop:895 length:768 start_codon:yes stop_codon:yes gene_type:complete
MRKMTKLFFGMFLLSGIIIAQVNTESMRKEDAEEGFTNTMGFEFGFEKSDQEVLEIAGEYRIDYFSPGGLHAFLIMNYENGYEKESDEKNTIVNKGFRHLRMTKNISPSLYIELFTQTGFNDFLLIKDRKLYGSGLRYKAMEKEKINAFIGIGMMKEDEKYDLESDRMKSLYRSTNYLRWQLNIGENTVLNNTAYYQLDTSEPNDYRLLYDGDLEFELNEKLTFTFTLNYRYDSEPHGTLGKTYIQVNNGIEFSF